MYYVGPNVIALEKRFAFPPREFRLWLALHEVTHRAQFTGVPWLRQHFLSLVERSLDGVEPDPKRLMVALRRVIESSREGRSALEDGGLVALLATPEQGALLQQIGGMMSLLEGHGDVTMDRAGAGRIPSSERFVACCGSVASRATRREVVAASAGLRSQAQPVRARREVHRGR